MVAFPSEGGRAIRIRFPDKNHRSKFCTKFYQSIFGKDAEIVTSEVRRYEPTPLKTNTTFTGVINSTPISTKMEYL